MNGTGDRSYLMEVTDYLKKEETLGMVGSHAGTAKLKVWVVPKE